MMLNLISGVERSSFLLIKDCYEHSGIAMFKALLNYQNLNESKTVELFCYEYSPAFHINDLKNLSKVNIHDGYTDPLKWNSHSQLDSANLCGFDLCSNLQNVCHLGKTTLMIDSLSHVLLNIPVDDIYKVLNSYLKRNNQSSFDQIIACVHSDVHKEEVLSKLEHLASSIFTLAAESPNVCTIVHKKPNGQVTKKVEHYFVTENFSIHIGNSEVEHAEQQEVADPAADLTFNLHLKDDERTARDRLVLPYVKQNVTETDGTIYYQPDDDSEDPDDDLDI